MLVNLPTNSFILLSQLNHSTFKFYLTGSRFFGYSLPQSDWDFYTNSDPRLEQYLKGKGFKRIPMKVDWIDPITDIVYRHGDGIEVALVNNIELKKKAQIYIRDIDPYLIQSLREDPLKTWVEVYKVVLEHIKNREPVMNTVEVAVVEEERFSMRLER